MNISTLITELEDLKKDHGDLDTVTIWVSANEVESNVKIETVEVLEDVDNKKHVSIS